MTREKGSPSRTLLETLTKEEVIKAYGEEAFFKAWLKSLSSHSSSRNKRRRARVKKRLRKNQRIER